MAQGSIAEVPQSMPAGRPVNVWARDVHLSTGGLMVGVLVLGAALRFLRIGQTGLWSDEAFSVVVTWDPWSAIPSLIERVDSHPPLYYFLLKAWIAIAGSGEGAVRIPSAAMSLGSVALTYAFARRVASRGTAVLAAFLVAVSSLQIMAAQEARMYAMLGCFVLWSTFVLLNAVERGGALRWTAYVVLSVLVIYTHYLGGLVLIAHGIWVAGYERRHLRSWMAAIAAVAVLYTPWMPVFWHQVVHRQGWTWYRDPVSYQTLTGLLGLYAFGGSLLGMPTFYFSNARISPIGQILLLLPFLVLLWRGVTAFRSDPRRLALIVLPPVVTIGAMFAISLAAPMFYSRWFSFLYPFYAIILARGIIDVGGAFAAARKRVIALVTAGTLAFTIPVLYRYYLDPTFRPYHWRAAADLVRRELAPSDFFVFANSGARVGFLYYFRDLKRPFATLTPRSDRRPDLSEVMAEAGRHPRVWFVMTPPIAVSWREAVFSAMERGFRLQEDWQDQATWVYLFERRTSAER
jgi:mannosyltransferase